MAKPVLVKTTLDKQIEDIARHSDQRILAIWAADCAERVLPYFENSHPRDRRPQVAIEACREWGRTGIFRMADVRRASLDAHAAARESEREEGVRTAARAAGQAVATAHVATHAIAAALYGASSVYDATNSIAAATKEREWQYERLLECQKAV